jgi:hypothetical protein
MRKILLIGVLLTSPILAQANPDTKHSPQEYQRSYDAVQEACKEEPMQPICQNPEALKIMADCLVDIGHKNDDTWMKCVISRYGKLKE